MTAMSNSIPRKFDRITAEVLIETNKSLPGDVLHIYKNDFGHLALNMRTMEYAYYPLSLLRDDRTIRVMEIEK
jgi:hypothetical protein